MKIIFATNNKGKIKEIKEIFEGTGFDVVSMEEAGIHISIEENGETFEENSYIKAKAIWDITGGCVMADDSGFMVDYMGGAPGVYSSRFMGEDTDYDIKCTSIIKRLENAPGDQRGAGYKAVITAIMPDGKKLVSEGTVRGTISHEMKGTGGFGYDPIFYLPQLKKTMAELSDEEKNSLSHRGIALRNIIEKYKSAYPGGDELAEENGNK